MINILQRQHVSRRTAPSVPERARNDGVRWSRREVSPPGHFAEPAGPRPDRPLSILRLQEPRKMRLVPRHGESRGENHGETHSFLRGQIVLRTRRAVERREERRAVRNARQSAAFSHRARPESPAGPRQVKSAEYRGVLLAGILRNPWFLVACAVAAGAAVLVPMLGASAIGLPHPSPVLPSGADVDPALYDLQVPAPEPQIAGTADSVLLNTLKVTQYRTVRGDSLSRIAARFKLNIDTVVSWNGIRDARSLTAGTDLAIPSRNGLKYTVRRGDTLLGIAKSWGVDFNGILDANMLSSPVITVGQDLFLPDARMNPNDLNRILGNLFTYPVLGRISSYFGERPDPFTGVPDLHNGIDIVNRPGSSIVAATAGTVRAAAFNFNYGNYVILQHAGGYQTLYGHLTRSVVSKGQKVSQGQKIGELGSTGYSTGPHLHFSIFKNGEAVDPLRFLK